jgi:hypothetical protein
VSEYHCSSVERKFFIVEAFVKKLLEQNILTLTVKVSKLFLKLLKIPI